MSNYEWGMFLILVICIVSQIITVVEADKRIKEEKKRYREQCERAYLLNNRLNSQKRLNIQLEKELVEAKGTAIDYEEFLLDSEDETIATADYYEKSTLAAEENSLQLVAINDIATELCKREDVKWFVIHVKNDKQNYSLSGGH